MWVSCYFHSFGFVILPFPMVCYFHSFGWMTLPFQGHVTLFQSLFNFWRSWFPHNSSFVLNIWTREAKLLNGMCLYFICLSFSVLTFTFSTCLHVHSIIHMLSLSSRTEILLLRQRPFLLTMEAWWKPRTKMLYQKALVWLLYTINGFHLQ